MRGFAGVALVLLAACGEKQPPMDSVVDSAAIAAAYADSLSAAAVASAPAFRDSATTTLAKLLDDPTTATFDSVTVVQPPAVDGRLPARAVCGRIGGRPGIEGRAEPTRFIYHGPWTVFVDDAASAEKFAELWAESCTPTGAMVQLSGE